MNTIKAAREILMKIQILRAKGTTACLLELLFCTARLFLELGCKNVPLQGEERKPFQSGFDLNNIVFPWALMAKDFRSEEY